MVQLIAKKDQLISELKAQKDHLATRNDEQAAEIETLKAQLKEWESSHALRALQETGVQTSQSSSNVKHTC